MRAQRGHRSTLKRARGLGSARTGFRSWWWQRLTAVALLPLTLWFVVVLVATAGGGHRALLTWLANPVSAIAMVLLLTVLLWHMALGLTVVAEDYLHHVGIRSIVIAVIQLVCLTLVITGFMAVARLAFATV